MEKATGTGSIINYTAIGVSTPISLSSNFPQIIYCAGIKGNNSPVGISSIDQLNNKQTHSFTSGDIVVFLTKDQVIPRFLVRYKAKGT